MRWKRLVQGIRHRGTKRFCPVCGISSKLFAPFGNPDLERSLRKDARCLQCGSLERHRMVWMFFQEKTDLFQSTKKKVLHVAPEVVFQSKLKRIIGPGYLSGDLLNPNAMIQLDITAISYPENHFDIIYCSHVLEHVPDDKSAMAELFRVLKPGGWAVMMVPIEGEITDEDFSVTEPAARLQRFGQEDHVRQYGLDFSDRLKAAGFQVETFMPSDWLTKEVIDRCGIGKKAGEVFYCVK